MAGVSFSSFFIVFLNNFMGIIADVRPVAVKSLLARPFLCD
jgi:hypothetical protein